MTIGLAVVSLFLALFPDVMPSSTIAAYSLTTTNAASTEYTLTIMTVVAVIFVPLVLGYQAWSYWVFRKRVTRAAGLGRAVSAAAVRGRPMTETGLSAGRVPGPP